MKYRIKQDRPEHSRVGVLPFAYKVWLCPVSEARWIAASNLWRVTAVSKSGSARSPLLIASANRPHNWAMLNGGPWGTDSGTQV